MNPSDVEHAILRMLPPFCAASCIAITPSCFSPYSEVREVVRPAVLKRKLEFFAGRMAARSALAKLGVPAGPILVGRCREPMWPAAAIGSISHTNDIAACAAVNRDRVLGLGLDIAEPGSVSDDLWELLFTDEERKFLHSKTDLERREHATVFFSAKEAFFKFQYPLTQTWLDFKEATLCYSDSGQTLLLTTRRPIGSADASRRVYQGRVSCSASYVITTFCVEI